VFHAAISKANHNFNWEQSLSSMIATGSSADRVPHFWPVLPEVGFLSTSVQYASSVLKGRGCEPRHL